MTKSGSGLLFAISILSICAADGRTQSPKAEQPQVDLTLTIPRESYILGDPIPVRVTLLNRGRDVFFIGRYLTPSFSNPSYVVIGVEDSDGNFSPLDLWTEFLTPEVLAEWWVPLTPGHFYGTELSLGSETHAFLKKPGRYRLRAKYISTGRSTSADTKRRKPAYRVWKGELESNAVWVEIVPRQK